MGETIREILDREAREAEAVAEIEEQRHRKSTYRWYVFVGLDLPGERDNITSLHNSWTDAVAEMNSHIEPKLLDECDDCRAQAVEAQSKLAACAPDTHFWAEVDGYMFSITPVTTH